MLKRKVEVELENWKKRNHHNPLILTRARQIGKTTSIENFAKSNYASFIEINFYKHPEYK